jgi:hypothetical protein
MYVFIIQSISIDLHLDQLVTIALLVIHCMYYADTNIHTNTSNECLNPLVHSIVNFEKIAFPNEPATLH